MKLFNLFQSDERGVSPVIGIVVVIALTVGVGAIVGASVISTGDTMGTQSSQPTAQFSTTIDNDTAYITHMGGDSIATNQISVNEKSGTEVFVDADGNPYDVVTAGDTGSITLTNDTTEVTVSWENDGSSTTLDTQPVNADIEDPTQVSSTFTEGFESGTYTNTFVDISSTIHSPEVVETNPYNGSYRLNLESSGATSSDGDTSFNGVKTIDNYTNISHTSVRVNKFASGGDQYSWSYSVQSENDDSRFMIYASEYYDNNIYFREYDGDGNIITDSKIDRTFAVGEWNNVEFDITEDNVTVTINGQTTTAATEKNWYAEESTVQIGGKGWSMGDNFDMAIDNFELKTEA